MVNVYVSPAKEFEPKVRILSAAGGEFISISLDESLTVQVPGEPEQAAIYAHQLSMMLSQAADHIQRSLALQRAAARREQNAYATATIAQAADAMLGRAV